MYSQDIAKGLGLLYGDRTYTAAEVASLIDSLCAGLTVAPSWVELGGKRYQLPEASKDVATLCHDFPKWVGLEIVLCGAILDACELPHKALAPNAIVANYRGLLWLYQNKAGVSNVLRAVAILLDFAPGASKQEPDAETMAALQLALTKE